MRLARAAAAAAALLAAAAPAQAHTVIEGVSGFPGGLLHPLLVPAHALLLVTLGLLAGAQTAEQRRILMPLFPLALIAAVVLIILAFAYDSQSTVLWLCALNGALLALAWPLPLVVPAVLIAAGGIALMLDSVPALLSVQDTLSALSGTAFSALAVFTLFAALSARTTQPWQTTGRRIVGSWAAASAVLVLALRFVK
jgi:urease accessory protein